MESIIALNRAIEIAGGQTALAILLGKKQGHVSSWLSRGGAPASECAAIEAATGIRCEDLRPDLYWLRDVRGAVTGYFVPTPQPRKAA